VLFARNVEDGEVNALVVEKDTDGNHPAGYDPTVITGKIGKRAILQADIVIRDLRIPAGNRLVECRVRGRLARAVGHPWRCAWEAVGHAIAGFQIAADYASRWVQFGKPIAGYQLVQARLATCSAN
jgi:glutaryl-CoA dehydrogenase